MDHAERQRLKQLANDSIIATFGQGTNEARLAQALESTVDALGYYDETMERNTALEEENGELDDQVRELTEAIRDIYRVSKSANSSDGGKDGRANCSRPPSPTLAMPPKASGLPLSVIVQPRDLRVGPSPRHKADSKRPLDHSSRSAHSRSDRLLRCRIRTQSTCPHTWS